MHIVPPPNTIDQEPLPVEDIGLEDQHITDYSNRTYDDGVIDLATSKDDATGVEEDDALQDLDVIKIDGSYDNDNVIKGTNNSLAKKKRMFIFLIALAIVLAIVVGAVVGTRDRRQSNKAASSDDSSVSGVNPFSCSTASTTCASVKKTNGTFVSQMVGSTLVGEDTLELFGMALSVNCDGSMIAVGSAQHENRTGQVKVFYWVTTTTASSVDDGSTENSSIPSSSSSASKTAVGDWFQLGQTLQGDLGSANQFGHAVSLSANGMRLAVSGRFADTALANGTAVEDVGSVQVFEFSGNHFSSGARWEPVGQVLLGEAADDQSGRSIQLNWDGTRLVIGASGSDGTASQAGHARVYEWVKGSDPDDAWVQLGSDIDGESEEDGSGSAVSLSADGSVVAVGAHKNDAEGSEDAGHVRVYSYSDGRKDWVQVGGDIDGRESGEWAGFALALSGDGTRLVVGISGKSDDFLPGVARVYDLINGTTWLQMGDDLDGGGDSVDISYDGRRVALGSHRGSENGANTGQVLVYQCVDCGSAASSAFEWVPLFGQENAILGEQGSMFGTTVALTSDGGRVVGSAPATAGNGTDASLPYVGSVTAHDLCPIAA